MFATLTLNPCLDKTVQVPSLDVDDALRATAVRYDPGGKGLNVSRVLYELGHKCLSFGFLGGHTGQRVEAFLKDEGLCVDFNWTAQETRENLILVQEGAAGPIRISLPGPTVGSDELARLRRKLAGSTAQYEVLVLSGSLPPGVPQDSYRILAEEAKLRGDAVVLDADGEALLHGLMAGPMLIKPNRHEFRRLLGRELKTEKAMMKGLEEALERFTVESILLSDGPSATWLATREGLWRGEPPKIKVGSAVGAGDSMLAGYLSQWAVKAAPGEALRWAIATGTACATSTGTELATLPSIQHHLPLVKVERLS